MTEPLLQVESLRKAFPIHGGILGRKLAEVKAVDGVSFTVRAGETLGLVGESGCGKTTVGRTIIRLLEPTDGRVLFAGKDLAHLKGREMREMRKHIQMIFQDPFESLNARQTVRSILEEPFIVHGQLSPGERSKRAGELLETVGLASSALEKFPHEFSGGQRQRIGIARALTLNPSLIICDEPVSALDVSVQAQILNLLLELQKSFGLSYVFIAHDLAVVKHISDRIAVMYLGQIVEIADAAQIYESPQHPYTEALLSAIPMPDPTVDKKRIVLKGEVPSPVNPPPGCRFHTRCPYAKDICATRIPQLSPHRGSTSHQVACHFPLG